MQVFDFFLTPDDPFCFLRNSKGNVTHLREPNNRLVREDETLIYVPAMQSTPEEIEEMVKRQILPVMEVCLKDFPGDNIFVARKQQDNQVEIGIFGLSGFATNRNHQMETYIQRLMQLKAFW